MVVPRGDRSTKADAADRRQPASARKAQIVQAALRLVGELGLAGVGVARIAREIGITDAALYKHFRSREEILLAVHQQLSERVFAWLDSAQASNPVDRLREIGEVHAGRLSADVEYFNAPMFQYNSWICRDAVYEQVATGRQETRRWFMNLVEDGKAQGCIRSDIDTDLLVAEVLAWIWWEDLSYLQDREKEWAARTSAAMFAAILDRITVTGTKSTDVACSPVPPPSQAS
jgi:AcrR family transcriptional regulator